MSVSDGVLNGVLSNGVAWKMLRTAYVFTNTGSVPVTLFPTADNNPVSLAPGETYNQPFSSLRIRAPVGFEPNVAPEEGEWPKRDAVPFVREAEKRPGILDAEHINRLAANITQAATFAGGLATDELREADSMRYQRDAALADRDALSVQCATLMTERDEARKELAAATVDSLAREMKLLNVITRLRDERDAAYDKLAYGRGLAVAREVGRSGI